MIQAETSSPVREIRLLYGESGCTAQVVCGKYVGQFMNRMVGKYVGRERPLEGQRAAAVIDLREFEFERYMAAVRKVHKGNAVRDAQKADRAGFESKQFAWNNFLPDIVEINTSKGVRSGGPMKAEYLRTVDDLGGLPTKAARLAAPACPVHAVYSWGIFEPRQGYKQGDLVTDEKLLAYIKFKRQGSLGIYTSILGHGDYLKCGVMYRLHYAVMQWVAQNLQGSLRGLEFIMYGAIDSGEEGLQQWKKRGLFESACLVLGDAHSIMTRVHNGEERHGGTTI